MTAVLLTVDVEGDHGGERLRGVDEALPPLLDLLEELGAKAVFFVVGAVARQRPEVIRGLVARGHTVGSHTMTHPALSRVAPARLDLELRDSRSLLQDVTGAACVAFRAPFFDAPLTLGPRLEEAGYTWSSSKAPFSMVAKYRHLFERKPHTLAGSQVKERPVPGVLGLPIPEGLSYHRLFWPLPALARTPPSVFYWHPADLLEDTDASHYGAVARRLVKMREGAWSRAYLQRLLGGWKARGATFEAKV